LTSPDRGDFRLLGWRRLARGVFLRFHRQHLIGGDGTPVTRDVVRHPGGVGILAIEGDRVWLVTQRRAPFGSEVMEIPAGRLDPGDRTPEEAARRELLEELGATASEWTALGEMLPSPGYSDEVIHLFAAQGLSFGDRRPDGSEERQAVLVPLPAAEALLRIGTGDLTDAKTQLALLLWDRKRRVG
jgi:ADP-ribose pyrophosphatase